jgi:hypothetical protein
MLLNNSICSKENLLKAKKSFALFAIMIGVLQKTSLVSTLNEATTTQKTLTTRQHDKNSSYLS